MKLYVVTSGEYSDYGIDCIFLDKTKAENYVRYHQDGWGGSRIEEYDTADEGYTPVSNGFHKISGEITITKDCKIKNLQTHSCYLVDVAEDIAELSDYSWSSKAGEDSWCLYIIRSFPENIIEYEGQPREKMVHILNDTAAMVADFRKQGYAIEEIREMMGFEK